MTDSDDSNVLKNLFAASSDVRIFNSDLQNLEKRRFLTLSLIPEDGSEPQLIKLLQDGKATTQFDLEILLGDQLIEQFKNLPDGRYRLDLYRTLGKEILDERTVLETVITNGLPSNPLEDLIEQLRRNLDVKIEPDNADPTDGQGAMLDTIPREPTSKTEPAVAASSFAVTGFGMLVGSSIHNSRLNPATVDCSGGSERSPICAIQVI